MKSFHCCETTTNYKATIKIVTKSKKIPPISPLFANVPGVELFAVAEGLAVEVMLAVFPVVLEAEGLLLPVLVIVLVEILEALVVDLVLVASGSVFVEAWVAEAAASWIGMQPPKGLRLLVLFSYIGQDLLLRRRG